MNGISKKEIKDGKKTNKKIHPEQTKIRNFLTDKVWFSLEKKEPFLV